MGVDLMNGLNIKVDKKLKVIIDELIDRMCQVFGDKLKKVVLFGSYARGDYDEESDIDLMFMMDEDENQLKKYHEEVSNIFTDINLKYDVLISGIIQDYNKFNRYINVLPFYNNVNNEGVILYER